MDLFGVQLEHPLYKFNHQGPPLGNHLVQSKTLHCVFTVVPNAHHLPFTTPTFTLKTDGLIYMGPYFNPNATHTIVSSQDTFEDSSVNFSMDIVIK